MMKERGTEPSEAVDEVAEPEDLKKTPSKKASDKEKSIMRVYIVILSLLVLAGGAYIVFQHFQNQKQEVEETPGGAGVLITKDGRGTMDAVRKKVAEGMITVKMVTVWTFEDGYSTGNGYVANSTSNSKPLKVKVTLQDTGDVVLETDPIPVGSCVENFKLSKVLEKGVYSAVVEHATVDENGEIDNVVRTQVTIEILN